MVKIQINLPALGRSRWYEYLVRFAFGGAVTVLAGIIGQRYGPGIGGLFLAFPAIFPATASMHGLEEHVGQHDDRDRSQLDLRLIRRLSGLQIGRSLGMEHIREHWPTYGADSGRRGKPPRQVS